MGTYDVHCPVCGKVNRDLYLDETDGWMECESCQQAMKVDYKRKTAIRPVVKHQPYVMALAAGAL